MLKKINKISYELPREKLLKLGVKSLSDAELLALLLKTGSKDKHVLELAHLLLEEFGNLKNLSQVNIKELTNYFGIGIAKAACILGAFEIGKRVFLGNQKKRKIRTSKEAFKIIQEYGFSNNEIAGSLFLDKTFNLIGIKVFFEGDKDNIFLNPKIILKYALKLDASYVIFFHSHPSGNLNPSKEDILFTKKLKFLLETLDVKLLDHLIIFENKYISLNSKI